MAQADIISRQLSATAEASSMNIIDQHRISVENMEETLRINREEAQRRQRLQTEEAHIRAHQIDVYGDVAKTAAESMGQMGSTMSFGDGGGMNPAGMMTGMMMGASVGNSMAGMMGNMMQSISQPQPPPPPQTAIAQYYLVVDGAQAGPFSYEQVAQMAQIQRINQSTLAWKQGMASWQAISTIPELAEIFAATPPPLPNVPPPPPVL